HIYSITRTNSGWVIDEVQLMLFAKRAGTALIVRHNVSTGNVSYTAHWGYIEQISVRRHIFHYLHPLSNPLVLKQTVNLLHEIAGELTCSLPGAKVATGVRVRVDRDLNRVRTECDIVVRIIRSRVVTDVLPEEHVTDLLRLLGGNDHLTLVNNRWLIVWDFPRAPVIPVLGKVVRPRTLWSPITLGNIVETPLNLSATTILPLRVPANLMPRPRSRVSLRNTVRPRTRIPGLIVPPRLLHPQHVEGVPLIISVRPPPGIRHLLAQLDIPPNTGALRKRWNLATDTLTSLAGKQALTFRNL